MDIANPHPTNEDLIGALTAEGVLRTQRIIEAFQQVDRRLFVSPENQGSVYADIPLPIGFGATISQPYTVAIMLEQLQPNLGDRCLDIGAGSGWTAALLGSMVGDEGRVTAVERIPQLAHRAAKLIASLNTTNVSVVVGDGAAGWPTNAPYDIIHVAAATERVPATLIDQLTTGGRLIIPIGVYVQELVLITKISDNRTVEHRIPGFQFVPLIAHS